MASEGYRNTTQRAVILDEVRAAGAHLTAGELFERVRRRYPTIAYGTVYRSLHLLVKHGLIQELTFADQASRFDARVERHDHVFCAECGLLDDVEFTVARIAQYVAADRSGFEIMHHHTMFTGRCPACRTKASGVRRQASGTTT